MPGSPFPVLQVRYRARWMFSLHASPRPQTPKQQVRGKNANYRHPMTGAHGGERVKSHMVAGGINSPGLQKKKCMWRKKKSLGKQRNQSVFKEKWLWIPQPSRSAHRLQPPRQAAPGSRRGCGLLWSCAAACWRCNASRARCLSQ